MIDRRRFLQAGAAAATALCLPQPGPASQAPRELPTRPIPRSGEPLPVIGMGNSNAFRAGDREASWRVIERFQQHGSKYIDVSGPSRFVVADVVREKGLKDDVFLGTYFDVTDEPQARTQASQLLATTGKPALDLMQAYPEEAVPHWDTFRRWKDEGLARYIGVARHQHQYYDAMMRLMQTGSVDFLQVNYSLLETEAEERILPMARDLGIAVTINRPFVNGGYFELIKGRELPAWAAEFDCTSWAQFSLKFILSHPAVNCVLTETANPKHALDNIGGGFGRLPDAATRQRMRQVIREIA
jgi:diketogulonate reductase-like aldo/keto reductase